MRQSISLNKGCCKSITDEKVWESSFSGAIHLMKLSSRRFEMASRHLQSPGRRPNRVTCPFAANLFAQLFILPQTILASARMIATTSVESIGAQLTAGVPGPAERSPGQRPAAGDRFLFS